MESDDIKSGPLYSYYSIDMAVLFFYGNDIERKQKNLLTNFLGKGSNQLLLVFQCLAAAVLCYLRRRHRLRRDGYISCWIDMLAAIFGGGTIRITHRLERWFFGIIFIPIIFLMAVWGGLVFYPTFFELAQSFKSIKEIASINPPIYISPTLERYEMETQHLLRCDRKNIILKQKTLQNMI